jgi:hypothetical protein
MGTRVGNGLDIFGTLNFAQPIELGLERLVPFSRYRCRHTSSKLQD